LFSGAQSSQAGGISEVHGGGEKLVLTVFLRDFCERRIDKQRAVKAANEAKGAD
jgi:hypothetical protein